MRTRVARAWRRAARAMLASRPGLAVWRRLRAGDPRFDCPICGYHGPFASLRRSTGLRSHARCPACSSLERHRLQYLVLGALERRFGFARLSVLHVAPERVLTRYLRSRCRLYTRCGLVGRRVDHRADLRALPFRDGAFDMVFASHVLEHIKEDERAIREIRRVLGRGGMAVLPVPIVASRTIEYPAPSPSESNHVRAPGLDYFDRYRRHFSRVSVYRSSGFPERHQLFLHVNGSDWTRDGMPLRPALPGTKHEDFVPVCFA